MRLECVVKTETQEFIQQTNRVSTLSFDELYSKFKSSVFSFAFYLTQNQSEAEDIFQEAWLRAVQNLSKIKSKHEFKAWIFTITANLFRDFLRKKRVRRLFLFKKMTRFYQEHETLTGQIESGLSRKTYELDQVDLGLVISQAIAKLPARQRQVFVLKEIEGFKLSEISEILKIPVGTVKSVMHRAVKRLRNELSLYKPH